MVPEVFLSLSGHDLAFAEDVQRSLPHGLTRIYTETFQNGESMLAEMEKGVNASTIFVLLASRASLASHWVNFELDIARLQLVQKKSKIFCFAIEEGLKASDFPAWLRSYWIDTRPWNAKDIGRYVQEALFSEFFSESPLYQRVIGRGSLVDQVRRQALATAADYGRMPNVIVLAGNVQIGRRTFAKYFLNECFPWLSKPKQRAGNKPATVR